MDITLYKFSKRINSTQRPESNATAERTKLQLQSVKINSTTDVTTIYIILSAYKNGVYTAYSEYNYCHVPFFKRYYWIREWRYNDNGTVMAIADVDPLASFSEFIANGSGYINRSSNPALANDLVIDTLYPATANYKIVDLSTIRNEFSARPGAGTFIIGVLGKQAPVYGAINYYKINTSQMATLINNMLYNSLNPPDGADAWKLASIGSDVLKSIVSPIQYIVSCKWFPVFDAPSPSHSEEIFLGTWNTGTYGEKIQYNAENDQFQYHSFSWIANVPRVAENDADYNRYRKYPPYATYSMYNSLTGMFTIDPILCASRDKLMFTVDINYASGEGRLTCRTTADADGDIEHDSLNTVFVRNFKAGIAINLSQIAVDYVGLAKSAINVVGSVTTAFTSDPLQGAFKAVSNAIDAAKFALSPQVQSVNGNGEAFWRDINVFKLIGQFQLLIEPYPVEFGYPVERPIADTETLFDYWFYFVQCFHFHPGANSLNDVPLKNEYDMIIEYLRNGVFLE